MSGARVVAVGAAGGPTVVRTGTAPTAAVPVVVPGSAATAGAVRHAHVQDVPQSVWPIHHGKGRPPIAWVLRDQSGRECEGYEVQLMDDDTVRVAMDDPTAGTILLIF